VHSSVHFFCVHDTKYKQTSEVQELLHKVGRSWISEVQNWSESSSDDLQ